VLPQDSPNCLSQIIGPSCSGGLINCLPYPSQPRVFFKLSNQVTKTNVNIGRAALSYIVTAESLHSQEQEPEIGMQSSNEKAKKSGVETNENSLALSVPKNVRIESTSINPLSPVNT
ncbi:unnamed protein product, partial [Hymenolepis diminuta]